MNGFMSNMVLIGYKWKEELILIQPRILYFDTRTGCLNLLPSFFSSQFSFPSYKYYLVVLLIRLGNWMVFILIPICFCNDIFLFELFFIDEIENQGKVIAAILLYIKTPELCAVEVSWSTCAQRQSNIFILAGSPSMG